jgi:HK97 gp10 family phage protein
MPDTTHVKGLAELQKFLDALPKKVEKNIMRSALRAGAMVIMEQAKANVPVKTGALRDSLRVSTGYKNGKVTATVKAGGKTKRGGDAFYAHMVEFGTSAHNIAAKAGGWLSFMNVFAKEVAHPGARAKPFLRPAMDARAQDALVAVGEQIKKRLTKEGLDASHVMVEGDE